MNLNRKSLCIAVPFSILLLAGCPDTSKPASGGASPPGPQPKAAESPPQASNASETADTVVDGQARDPVCGMNIAVAGKQDSVYRGTRFHFCSASCLEKFQAEPSKTTTGLPQEDCVCTVGEMQNCDCGHCEGKPERCTCGDPKSEGAGDGDHDHGGHDHGDHGDH